MMIMSNTVHGHEQDSEQTFWSDVYRGRPIAVLNTHGRWHVYLDHMLQHNVVFASARQAIDWLTARIDHGRRDHLH
jgi:hypothetical protein